MGVEIGQVIDGKFRVAARIGEGGMGAVFAGEHLRLHRRVAIKVLHAQMALDAEVVRRFEREAQAAGKIGNDHILEVLDIGELPSGERFMVMEFLDGEAMNARLQRMGRLMPRQVYPLVRQLLEGLGAAHAAGIVHRDLKPANVFIQREKAGIPDYVKIIDFGISKFQDAAGDQSKTRTGMIIGTPLYMSPEQARGLREADWRTDLYAVGVILYESVTGRLPFTGESPTDLLFQIALSTPPPIATIVNDVDPSFCSIVERAMARDPAARFQTAAEFVAALDAWAQTGQGVAAPPTIAAAAPYPRPTQPISLGVTPGPTAGTPWASSQGVVLQPPSRRPVALVAALVAGLVVVGLVGVLLVMRGRAAPAAAAPVTSAATTLPVAQPSAAASPAPPASSLPVVVLAPEPSATAAPSPSASASSAAQPPRVAGPPAARRGTERPAASAAPPSNTGNGYNPFGHL